MHYIGCNTISLLLWNYSAIMAYNQSKGTVSYFKFYRIAYVNLVEILFRYGKSMYFAFISCINSEYNALSPFTF